MSDLQKQLNLVKSGDRETLKNIYLAHQKGFTLFARRYTKDQELIQNAYQEAIILFAENAQNGKIKELKSSVSTYLFAIGKYVLFRSLKSDLQQTELDEQLLEGIVSESEEDASDAQVAAIQIKLKTLGPRCREILRLFYYQSKSLDEIASILGYESKDVLKSTKSRCLKALKDAMQKL